MLDLFLIKKGRFQVQNIKFRQQQPGLSSPLHRQNSFNTNVFYYPRHFIALSPMFFHPVPLQAHQKKLYYIILFFFSLSRNPDSNRGPIHYE